MRSGHIKGLYMLYRFDGTYEVGERKYPTVYGKPVLMTKICPSHHTLNNNNPHYIYTKARSAGASFPGGTNSNVGWAFMMDNSLGDIKTKCCQYIFTLDGDVNFNYTTNMTAENIRYHDKEMFCHVATDFGKETLIHKANYEGSVDSIFRLKVVPVYLSNVKTTEEFLDKINLFALFS